MSDIDIVPACPATADPALDTMKILRRPLVIDVIDVPGSSALQRLVSVEASASPAMITRSQSSEMQTGFFALSLARTPSSSDRARADAQ